MCLRFTILGDIFTYVTVFESNHEVVTFRLRWMVHAGYVFVAGIHPSMTCMSGSFESARRNACVHRLDLGLYSHPKDFFFFGGGGGGGGGGEGGWSQNTC